MLHEPSTPRLLPFVAGFAAAAAVLGCTDLQSSKLQTSGMTASLSVTANGAGSTTASAELNVDTNLTDFVELTPGDTLSATTGSQTEAMSESKLLGIVDYTASFTGADKEGTAYTIALKRAEPNKSAPSSTCTIPAPFDITAPTASASASRAADLVVTYGPSGLKDPVTYSLRGDCIDSTTGGTVDSDSGMVTIAKNTIKQPMNATANCQVTLTITRSRAGTLDSAYGGGSIQGRQVREVTFTSTP